MIRFFGFLFLGSEGLQGSCVKQRSYSLMFSPTMKLTPAIG